MAMALKKFGMWIVAFELLHMTFGMWIVACAMWCLVTTRTAND